jgi:hypothetical protein
MHELARIEAANIGSSSNPSRPDETFSGALHAKEADTSIVLITKICPEGVLPDSMGVKWISNGRQVIDGTR